jgi:hypothetical protein
MTKKIILIVLLMFGLTNTTQSQTSKHELGAFAASDAGLGFSYRYWPKKFGIQLTAIPIFQQNQSHFISTGLSLLYLLKQSEKVDLYAYAGYHFISRKNQYVFEDTQGKLLTEVYVNETHNTGLGVGFKFKIFDVVSLNLQGGYGIYNISKYNTNYGMSGGIGLYYIF